MVVKPVPAGATAVGNPARILDSDKDSERDAAREQKAEQFGFSAYGVTRDMDDPVAKALHGLLDHSVETDRRLQAILARLEAAGIKLDDTVAPSDHFDPGRLSRMVD